MARMLPISFLVWLDQIIFQSQLEAQQELYNALGGLEKIQIWILALLHSLTASAVNCHLGIALFF